ncbi:MAG TPA: FtsX-like permease family protein [Candidatus Acidoferrales bacterium]|nr:FtsX-like permease family protein [Candidatus Acidoferrales bacterium]
MFWRVLKQLLRASRGRLVVAVIAVAAGAAVTTALLNLQWDAESKLGTEFRSLGANILILPRAGSTSEDGAATDQALLAEDVTQRIVAAMPQNSPFTAVPYLFVAANLVRAQQAAQPVLLTGTWLDQSSQMAPWWKIEGNQVASRVDVAHCLVGRSVAKQFNLAPGAQIELRYQDRTAKIDVAGVITAGGDEDSQIFANLATVQSLAGLPGKIGVVQLSVPGAPHEISSAMNRLAAAFPELDVRPVRQIAEAQGQLIGRLRGLIFAMVLLILVLTALCVLASMAALAMERRHDVGLMKAIGGSMSRIVAIFLTEAGALGLAGGLAGYAIGVALSRWIGRRAFDVAIDARPEVLPLVVALMIGVSLAGAAPLRLLGRVRPAEILRGE